MATQEELNREDKARSSRIEEGRAKRRQRDELKAIRNAERAALRQSESAGERRRIKEAAEKAKGRVYDLGLDYTPPDNTESIETATNDTFGNDEFTLSEDESSGDLPAGVEIIWQDQTVTLISRSSIESAYTGGYTSMTFEVVGLAFTRNIVYDSDESLFEDDGLVPPTQTKYRLRLQTLDSSNAGVQLSAMGQYREVITVINGYPYVTLVKVS